MESMALTKALPAQGGMKGGSHEKRKEEDEMKKQPKLAGHLKKRKRGDTMATEVEDVFGKFIRESRQNLGLTQKQLGLMCGYSEASADRVVQLWEHDKQPVPLDKLRILAKSLQVPLDSLIP